MIGLKCSYCGSYNTCRSGGAHHTHVENGMHNAVPLLNDPVQLKPGFFKSRDSSRMIVNLLLYLTQSFAVDCFCFVLYFCLLFGI